MLTNIEYTFDRSQDRFSSRVDVNFRRDLYLFYKDVLHNIVKHARASCVTVTLEHTDGTLALCVTDDGVGFDEAVVRQGHGHASMYDRADRLDGTLRVHSRQGEGTTVRLGGPRSLD